ncbi:class I adenylate-forming enzyme family protein [Parvularcula oceani]|uniref:class I adenylate-forming enzyme family protein n=1 Tax=Parvularcula oceani TaxID=1247963 RepID=UPI0004E0C99A|nr:AMP-binding protein [Parvularcula oceani]
MTVTYRELIERGARAHADRVAVTFEGESRTFSQVNALANALAHALIGAGAARGERVALLAGNSLLSVPLDFACVKAGLNRVPLNARLSLREHAAMLSQTGCERLIFEPSLSERAGALKQEIPQLSLHALGQCDDGQDLLAAAETAPRTAPIVGTAPDDVVLTLFTSGTTGTLKAAQHTQSSYAGICRNVMANLISPEPGDAMAHAASLIHASGVFVLPFWLRGARTVILPGFDPSTYLGVLRDEKITAINLVPTMLQMLLDRPDFENRPEHLRQVIYGASPMPRPVIERAMKAWGRERFWQYYGQTECPLCIAVLRPEHHEGDRLGACGQPAVDVEIRLVGEDGADVPGGEPGEIAVRSPSMMAGYHDADDLNAETRLPGGWLRTRDVGVFDEAGFLTLKDRTSDMIVTGGYNVYPREVEDVLSGHPGVAECVVVGVPDDKWVEAVCAVVVPRAGHDPDEGELIAHAASALASYKKPRRVVFAQAIPKTAVGKLDRKAVRASLRSGS